MMGIVAFDSDKFSASIHISTLLALLCFAHPSSSDAMGSVCRWPVESGYLLRRLQFTFHDVLSNLTSNKVAPPPYPNAS
ncbi:hypothetical protein B0T09DRAFT_337673 [Sordaria sp. MPI-SDFR-AT-0083]|nr:hypothetical protein B0T09DRAFT_337673 [Sordaria sp. MPI-SDFR-AT-0083]